MTCPPVGRRERKKAATRQALADAALALFLERGFDKVTVAEIAEAADVSTATLFKHFPSKEALLFDRDADRESALVAAVRERPQGTSILDALQAFLITRLEDRADGGVDTPDVEGLRRFRALVVETPGLMAYAARMWARHADALADAIAAELGLADIPPVVRAFAHLVVQAPGAARGEGARERLDAYFDLLRTGWDAQQDALRVTGR
jgi:AcrR family transcriptional regulator